MVGTAIGVALLVLVVCAACHLPARPSIAVALLITLYGVEQMLMSLLPFVAANPSLYNFAVGGLAALSIVISLYRFGLPRIPTTYLGIAVLFFAYTCLSALWTRAPITAREWLTHFVAEIPLCILVPICMIRRPQDLEAPLRLVIVIAALVAVSLVVNPAQEIGGRTYLVGMATVLSPAEMTGAALVLLTTLDKRTLGHLARWRIPASVVMALALFQSGARGQFLLAMALPAIFALGRRFAAGLTSAALTALAVVLSVVVFLSLVAFDVDLRPSRSPERYSVEDFQQGLSERTQFIRESLTFDSPLFGHGVADWSYMHNRTDFISKLDRSRITYPHNSVVHVYYELGVVGLAMFLALVFLPIRQGYALLRIHASSPVLHKLSGALLLYALFSFGLSLKQNTYLAILGFYLSGSMIATMMAGARAGLRRQRTETEPVMAARWSARV